MLKVKTKWVVLFLAPAVLLFLVLYALPLVTVVGTSFFNYRLGGEMEFAGFSNYIKLFTQDKTFRQALLNTTVWIFLQCFLHVGLGVLIALFLGRRMRGWKIARASYIIPNIISSAAMGMIFVQMYNPEFGLINNVLRAVGMDNWTHNWLYESKTAFISVTLMWFLFAGYTTTLVLGELLSISDDLLDAARVDGASGFQLDFYIILPLLKNIIATTMIMAASYMLQTFALIYVSTGGGPGNATMNLTLYLYRVAMKENNYGYANTIGTVIIGMGLLIMMLINRLFKTDKE